MPAYPALQRRSRSHSSLPTLSGSGLTVISRTHSVRFHHPAVLQAPTAAAAAPRLSRSSSLTRWTSGASQRSSTGASVEGRSGCFAPLRDTLRKSRTNTEGPISLLSTGPRRRRARRGVKPWRMLRRSLGSYSGTGASAVQQAATLAVGRRALGDEWPPATEWPQAPPRGSGLPAQAAVLSKGCTAVMRDASLRPGLLLVHNGPRVRIPVVERTVATYSVWNGAPA